MTERGKDAWNGARARRKAGHWGRRAGVTETCENRSVHGVFDAPLDEAPNTGCTTCPGALTSGAEFCETIPVNNSDVLRRLRYSFDLSDRQVIDLFAAGGLVVTRELISNLMKKEEDASYEPCSNVRLSAFLNGFIVFKRGAKEGAKGPPTLEHRLTNNDKLRKLKIALSLKEGDMHELMALAGMPLSRPEMSALFRKTDHKHYRECQDQILRNFLQGLQLKYRDGLSLQGEPEDAKDVPKEVAKEVAPFDLADFEALPGFVPRPGLQEAFSKDGITSPSEPQRLAFEAILSGKNVVIDSGTGTGKTLAYLLPLLQRLATSPNTRVVCLAPAPELAVQTLNVATRYKSSDLSVGALVGGGNQRKQKDRVQKSTRLVAGTPGRVLEVVAERRLKGVTTFVLDEPEPILGSEDADYLVEVLSRPPRPQVVIVGATFGANSERLIEHLSEEGDVVRVKAEESPLVQLITHYRLRVRDAGDRDLQLIRLLEKENSDSAIVYVNQPHLIRHVFRNLEDAGIHTATLSQERTKQQRQQALRSFSRGEIKVLVTSDRSATGVDVASVPWVVHYEPPRSPQGYVHRAGRTGRAGQTGRSLVLINDAERFILKGFETELGITFRDYRI